MQTAIIDAAKIIVEGSADSLMIIWYAFFAGSVGYIARTVREEKRVSWSRALLEALASSVVGLLVALMRTWLGWSFEAGGIAAILLGWAGSHKSIQLLERFVFKKLGLQDEHEQR